MSESAAAADPSPAESAADKPAAATATATAASTLPKKTEPTTTTSEETTRDRQNSESTSSSIASLLAPGLSSGRVTPLGIRQTKSASNSPRHSRNSSPSRNGAGGSITAAVAQNMAGGGGASGGASSGSSGSRTPRSRNNSHVDVSPHRPASTLPTGTTPSAAAIQRALSSQQGLKPIQVPDPNSKIPAPQKSTTSIPSDTQPPPHWPVPSRLKSPSPSSTRRNSLQSPTNRNKADGPPAINVKPATPQSGGAGPLSPGLIKTSDGSRDDDRSDGGSQTPSSAPPKPPSRVATAAKLATVNEDSGTGHDEEEASQQTMQSSMASIDDDRPSNATDATEDSTDNANPTESGSDSGGKGGGESRGRKPSTTTSGTADTTPRPKAAAPSKSQYSNLVSAKARSTTETPKNMTVETETVTSIPQAALSAGIVERQNTRGEGSGSLRLKPSNETIRPKKDRKKAQRKALSIQSGTASTKADIFEAKVASAVDEANSSDSDETFVYESNPPEPPSRPLRHHSRTSSATSLHSQLDPRASRGETHHRAPTGKRSMKFASNFYNAPADDESEQNGTVRSRAHHIGRFGRQLGDADTPLAVHPTSRRGHSATPSRQGSRPGTGVPSPKFRPSPPNAPLDGKKHGELSSYDLDMEPADDEQTPLLTMRHPRSARSRHVRAGGYGVRSSSLQREYERRQSWVSRCAGCTILFGLLVLVVFGGIATVMATTKPLSDVSVREIQNVLASETELMFDLLVGAVNENVVAVGVESVDLNVFAKARHAKTTSTSSTSSTATASAAPSSSSFPSSPDDEPHLWIPPTPTRRPYPRAPTITSASNIHLLEGVDHGTDPEPPDIDASTVLLGRIFAFDSPLSFDGSPLKKHAHYSTGELRLAHPGNGTVSHGATRWSDILHNEQGYELIVRGTLKYTLPLSFRTRSVSVGKSVFVRNTDNDSTGGGDGKEKPSQGPGSNTRLKQGRWWMVDGRYYECPAETDDETCGALFGGGGGMMDEHDAILRDDILSGEIQAHYP